MSNDDDERWDLFEDSLRLLGEGKWSEAEAVFLRLIEIEPEKYINWMMLGRCQLSQRKLVDAERSSRKALELHQGADTYNLLGCVLKAKESFIEAEPVFRRSLELNPRDATSWSGLSTVLFALNRDKESEQAARKSIDLKPDFFEGWLALGMLNLRRGEAEEAENHFRKLVQLVPRMPDAHNFLALSLSMQGKHNEASNERKKAASLRS